MARFLGISTDKISAAFEGMNEREKRMTVLFFSAVVLVLVVGVFYWVFSNAADRREEINQIQKYTEQISDNRAEYLTAKVRNGALRKAMASNRINLFSAVQTAASRLQLPPVQIEDLPNDSKGMSAKGGKKEIVREERVRFALRELSIDKFSAFLEELEGNSSDGVTKIVQMNIKTSFRAPDLIDVQMIAATFKQQG